MDFQCHPPYSAPYELTTVVLYRPDHTVLTILRLDLKCGTGSSAWIVDLIDHRSIKRFSMTPGRF
jgi:hypothetical protein